MEVNTKYLKVSRAKIEIPDDLVLGQYGVEVLVKGDIVKVENNDQQNGTMDVTFILKATEMKVVNK